MQLADDGNDTTLQVDSDGGGDGYLDLAVLSAVTGLGSADDLLTAGGIVV